MKMTSGSSAPVCVSVVIPIFNGAMTIEKALDSVLIQDVPLEIIMVDDGSSDDTLQTVSPYLDLPNVHLLINKTNMGAAASRNRGVRAASGRYIAFLDCDDWWEPEKLKKQLRLLKKTGYVLCATGRRLVSESGEDTGTVIGVSRKLTYKDLFFQNPINCSSVLIERRAAVMFPMENDRQAHEDYIMWMKVLRHFKYGCAVNEPLLNYRVSRNGKSGSKVKSALMTINVYRYMGFGPLKSLFCFAAYSVNGVIKYYINPLLIRQ